MFQTIWVAHHRANDLLWGTFFVIALLVGTIRWLLDIENEFWSIETLVWFSICGAIAYSVPYIGYRTTKYFLGDVRYADEIFGKSWKEYKANIEHKNTASS